MTQPEPTVTPTETPPTPQAGATKPWGDDKDFSPDKAWTLIQNLRGDIEKKNGRIAALEPHEVKARELEEAQKTEVQRATEALTAAEKRAADAELRAIRLEVATEKGLTPAQAKRLSGTTRDELLADADDFIASLPTAPQATTRIPVEALRPGALPNAPAPTTDEQIAELMQDPKKNLRALMALQNQKLAQIATERK